ncbi:putative nicotinamide N-methyltransferase [Escovopsis weberi]|uniref:Putative nicotinamide N-methyltransferase n=1 Tax=Escovopsis weberi TaxID=150374 RepID=A0A0M9VS74_ESCWE|nr:putative nicotinamide N-methyltransferase [Escovopsis weberi]
MAALTSRITLQVTDPSVVDGPEDFLSTSLGVIFPDDVTNQHGDAEHSLVYTSPHLVGGGGGGKGEGEAGEAGAVLRFDLAEPEGEGERRLFSHYLWNASLLLAELVERDSLLGGANAGAGAGAESLGRGASFDVRGLRTLELGAGTALPSVMAGLLGARGVAVTDYPAPAVLRTLRTNVVRNLTDRGVLAAAAAARAEKKAFLGGEGPKEVAGSEITEGKEMEMEMEMAVEGHAWGELDDAFCAANRRAFDRVMVADCLWMPWQHANLRRSVGHFLGEGAGARAWVVAGFHTGRVKMRGFFDAEGLRADGGLEVERIWEVDCDGVERAWAEEREEGISVRKRWLVVAVLKRVGA